SVNGTVSTGGAPLTGARIAAVDGAGLALSAPTTTADGGYSLLLPPGTGSYALQIGPPTDLNGGVTSADPLPNYDSVPYQPSLNLPLPAAATLTGKVVDTAGNGIASARVYARSAMGTPWNLSRSVNVDP